MQRRFFLLLKFSRFSVQLLSLLKNGKGGVVTQPFAEYDAESINEQLVVLSEGFSEKLLSTSLRDVYNRIAAECCNNDAEKMVKLLLTSRAKASNRVI